MEKFLLATDQVPSDDVEARIGKSMLKKGLMLGPFLLVISSFVWGLDGFLSSLYGLVLVLFNLGVSALILSKMAKRSFYMLLPTALGIYIGALLLITGAVYAVLGQSWVRLVPMLFTLGITHFVIVTWQAKQLSLTLANPGVLPRISSVGRKA